MSCRIVLLVGALVSLWTMSLPAEEVIREFKYGQGVHSYFAGNCLKAYEQLTASINEDSQDPRAYYFRGLAYLKLGRPQEAALDFQKGAELESRDVNKFYNAAKALERVQGTARVTLENYRIEARMAAIEEAERVRKARYEAIQQEESRVVRQQRLLKEAGQNAVAATGEVAPAVVDESDPFAAKAEPAGKAELVETPQAGSGAKKGSVLKALGKAVRSSLLGNRATDAPTTGSPKSAPTGVKPGDVAPAEKTEPSDGDDPFSVEATPDAGQPAEEAMPDPADESTDFGGTE
jgi:tetratricopeptide (TPR) repeat protein